MRTQFRQLIDLLGSKRADAPDELRLERYHQLAAQADTLSRQEFERIVQRPALALRNHTALTFLAYHGLARLSAQIPPEEQSQILREPGVRLRNRRLVAFLAAGEPKPAAAAVATARLAQDEWLALIPRMPVMARGFLRHRRDLPPSAKDLLSQHGVGDLVLPNPDAAILPQSAETGAANAPEPLLLDTPITDDDAGDKDGIRALLHRIEAFREARRGTPPSPRLPLGDAPDEAPEKSLESFHFTTDLDGRINWASDTMAPFVVGMRLGRAAPGVIAVLDERAATNMRLRQPLLGAKLSVDASPAIAGEWRIDAEPAFTRDHGNFAGYHGRIRRPLLAAPNTDAAMIADSPANRMREVLHELRTPVNAIQGFAEIIQQQLFGHAPNEYRAHAAAIAVDSAKLLASFDEIDRLTRLETGALDLEPGEGNLREVVTQTIQRLEGALRPRNAGFDLFVTGHAFTTALAREELMAMAWRILASLAGALAPSECVDIVLSSKGKTVSLELSLPRSLAAVEDKFATPLAEKRPALSSGMFGTGFAFRLARSEVLAAGGAFEMSGELLAITLPLLTGNALNHSNGERDGHAA